MFRHRLAWFWVAAAACALAAAPGHAGGAVSRAYINNQGGEAMAVELDVADPAEVPAAFDAAEAAFGPQGHDVCDRQ